MNRKLFGMMLVVAIPAVVVAVYTISACLNGWTVMGTMMKVVAILTIVVSAGGTLLPATAFFAGTGESSVVVRSKKRKKKGGTQAIPAADDIEAEEGEDTVPATLDDDDFQLAQGEMTDDELEVMGAASDDVGQAAYGLDDEEVIEGAITKQSVNAVQLDDDELANIDDDDEGELANVDDASQDVGDEDDFVDGALTQQSVNAIQLDDADILDEDETDEIDVFGEDDLFDEDEPDDDEKGKK